MSSPHLYFTAQTLEPDFLGSNRLFYLLSCDLRQIMTITVALVLEVKQPGGMCLVSAYPSPLSCPGARARAREEP